MVDSNAMGITVCGKNVPFITWPHCVGFVCVLGGMLWAEFFSQSLLVEVLIPVFQNVSIFRDRGFRVVTEFK